MKLLGPAEIEFKPIHGLDHADIINAGFHSMKCFLNPVGDSSSLLVSLKGDGNILNNGI